ncbi:MAG: UDP-N-acetylglucosamine 4,6-dehydratase (inverting) [Candidatus Omnitrophica bacterium]|nr:UDP-N-acetylglucosamine 4,6-dehydratase (inverting) [Candidatus Omnitrophota bacterium]MDD5352403.1 UDP-N-acetylglucosamine 4,6-dehydratase (inverting) [Candidatus Omnitrophota bacterium]MDD5550001.1 UDP-N-acetylglucosamine 4,6-dehydratase (inverting) [Candidatus Omnitrophota bacterium]
MDWSKKIILLTGGTGSFGQKFTEIMIKKHKPKVIRIFSRDELKQWEMEKKFNNVKGLRFFIGDVRDKDRLKRAMDGAHIVVHAAALKQVPLCEYNPFEAIKTNIMGAQNVIDAAIDHNIEKVMAISSDKAVNPVNLYGATKMCMEKLFVAANSYVGKQRQTQLSCTRYGNVVASRGSIVPLLKEQKKIGTITITDKEMTRFWMTLEQGVEFVIKSIGMMHGGEIFVPRIPSMKIVDLAKTIAPKCKVRYIGIRPGEKIHECLITKDESRHTLKFADYFIVEPEHPWWRVDNFKKGKHLAEGFKYTSDNNNLWLTKKELERMIESI